MADANEQIDLTNEILFGKWVCVPISGEANGNTVTVTFEEAGKPASRIEYFKPSNDGLMLVTVRLFMWERTGSSVQRRFVPTTSRSQYLTNDNEPGLQVFATDSDPEFSKLLAKYESMVSVPKNGSVQYQSIKVNGRIVIIGSDGEQCLKRENTIYRR